ncbi:MAG TPA: asparagine synthase-related protein [Thermoanaerobaculaceae bacterium]|nr:asparagine synthase-related protein [Thermoanaerobaculaceae bacterium]
MSGIVAVWRRDGARVAPDELDAPCAALGHRGPDGCDTTSASHGALAHHHFWTTPEEVGERQPVSSADGQVTLAFDGRIDNRDELFGRIGCADAAMSDAALVALAYARWGEACFALLLGPFAACVFDRSQDRVVLARDPLGDRTLYYHLNDRGLVVASEEAGVLAHGGVPHAIDRTTLARICAVEAPLEGETLFSGVRELPPGHVLTVRRDGCRLRAFWTPQANATLRLRSDGEYAEAFRELLRKAVICRMRARSPVGVMMSGGLDSPPIAYLAAQEMVRTGDSGPLRVFSWVFDELACDERRFMDPVIERYGFEVCRVVADDLWPLRDADSWSREPPPPAPVPFRLLHEAVWRQARSAGVQVLLSGTFGDELYRGPETWLLDLLRERRFAAAASGLLACFGRRGPVGLWRDPGFRHLAGRLVRAATPAGSRPPRAESRPWLTPEARDLIAGSEPSAGAAPVEDASRLRRISTPWEARSAPLINAMSNRHGVEVRTPYRDRRLVEFMASVPGHQVYRGGLRKHILREGMRGILPERVRLRKRPTSYLPLYNRGFFEREHATVRALLDDPDAWWPRFVRRDWLENAIRRPLRVRDDGVAAAVPWLCVVVELWRRTASPAEQAYLRLP